MGTLNDISASGVVNFHQKGTANLVIEQGSSEPGGAVIGQLFYNTTTHLLERYNGSAWIAEVSSVHADSSANITGNVQLVSGTNVTLTQSGSGITVASSGGGGGGGVAQVIQSTLTTAATTASATFVTTGLTLNITPSNVSHRIKLWVSGFMSPGAGQPIFTIKRGSTDLGSNNYGFGGITASTDTGAFQFACAYVDSPATTSSTTYTVHFRTDNAATVSFGTNGATCVLIAEEITV